MRKKILDVTLREFAKLCHKRKTCEGCPMNIYCGAWNQEEVWEEEVDLND